MSSTNRVGWATGAILAVVTALISFAPPAGASADPTVAADHGARTPIKHFVYLMQGDRTRPGRAPPDQAFPLPDAGRPPLRQLLPPLPRCERATGRNLPAAGADQAEERLHQAVCAARAQRPAAGPGQHRARLSVQRRQ